MIIELNGKRPIIGENVFIAPTAVVIGDVTIGDHASIWYGTVLRGDMDIIRIGAHTNIQDNCTLHTDWGKPAIVGDYVTVGHNAVVHGCTIEDRCLIGMGAVLLNGAVVQSGSVVAAGSVVREGASVGPNRLAAGLPAVEKKELTADDIEGLGRPIQNYRKLADLHLTLDFAETGTRR
jgi:carbonic anhydrase/acetyltransferase-like protein (isoleucine patch superfamily)